MTSIVHWCEKCQQPTSQSVEQDKNGEYVVTCGCGRFLKYPTKLFPTYVPPPPPTPVHTWAPPVMARDIPAPVPASPPLPDHQQQPMLDKTFIEKLISMFK